jgi:tetratricopeptide (TPR) repeat protein
MNMRKKILLNLTRMAINNWIILFLLSASSCNDWLDLKPSNAIIDNGGSIRLLSDVDSRLNGIYNAMRHYEYYGARMTYYGDATSEDMMAQSNTKRVANYYNFSFNMNTAPSTFWSRCYSIIGNTDLILESIDNLLEDPDINLPLFNDYKGQTLTVRALAYFDLTRLYGYPYPKNRGESMGVPIVSHPVPYTHKPGRNSVAECYAFILKDLNDAIQLLSESKNNGRFNKWAAMSLLSRVYLYKGDNENALKYARETIAGAEKNGYGLWTNAEYKEAWAKEFNGEVLFELPFTTTENQGNESIGHLVSPRGYDDIFLSNDWLVKLMGNETDDVRYQCVINNTSYNSRSGRRYMWKYPVNEGETTTSYFLGNVKVLRLSETYLIAAEAAARAGINDDAVKYLEPIVKRGNPAKTVLGTQVTLDRVLEERRKELVGEGHRFFDAIRNGKFISRSKDLAFPHLQTIQPEAWVFDWNYFKVVLPIPIAEMDANENIRNQQNISY